MEKPSSHSLSIPRGEFYELPSSSTSGYELCPDLIALVRELSFSRLSSKKPDYHLHEFEQLCLCFAFASMTQDVLRWKLFPFSLKGKAQQWYTCAAGVVNDSWDNLRKRFSIVYFEQDEKETLGAAWARFSLLVNSDPVLSILTPLLLHKFYKSLDKDSANYLDFITGGVSLHKILSKGSKILVHISKNTSFMVESKPL
jgi:hypothetical protein